MSDDIVMGKPVAHRWTFKSKSNPSQVPYETILYRDGTISCNCPGWTRRNANGVRECKHTLLIDEGIKNGTINTTGDAVAPVSAPRLRGKSSSTVRTVRRLDLRPGAQP